MYTDGLSGNGFSSLIAVYVLFDNPVHSFIATKTGVSFNEIVGTATTV